jgi:hypothetical protein
MFLTKRSLPRRTFLRGAGVALALPLLDAMVPAMTAVVRSQGKAQRRIGFVYIPHGVIMDAWTPASADGTALEFTRILTPLESFRNDMVVVSNLTRVEPNSNHAVSSGCWLTGVPPRRTDGPDFRAGTSVDQVIASARSVRTRCFPSLEVATEDFTGLLGACDPGYSCAYMNTLNWQSAHDAAPDGDQPARRVRTDVRRRQHAEERMRADAHRSEHSRLRARRGRRRLERRARRARPRRRVHEYLDHLREIERRIQRSEDAGRLAPDVPPEPPVGVPESFEEHVALMFDLLALAFQADLTRVFTFMMAREVSQRTYPNIGVTEPHHTCRITATGREASRRTRR